MKSDQIKHSLAVGSKSIQSRVYDRETGELISFVKIPLEEAGLVSREALAEQQSCDSKTGESETQNDLKFAGETQAQQQEPVSWERFMSVEKELQDMTAEFMRVAGELTALKEQPAQQQKPVAVVKALPMGHNQTDMHYAECQHLPVGTLLYTSPPASKPWVGLTDEELDDLWVLHHDHLGQPKTSAQNGWAFERAIEAKLREKNA